MMRLPFFRKQEPPAEDVSISELKAKVNSLFDKKVEKFSMRAASISSEISSTKKDYVSACDEFDALSVEPNAEYAGLRNPSHTKSQKGAYVTALKRLLSRNGGHGGPNSYSKYSSELSELEALISEIMNLNTHFKVMIASYPNYLGNFKQASARLESLVKSLRDELENAAADAREYDSVMERIYGFDAITDELEAEKTRLSALRPGGGGDEMAKNPSEISIKIAEKKKELSSIEKSENAASSEIASLLLPLGKAARAYDHAFPSKAKLSEIIEFPTRSLASPGKLDEFNSMLEDFGRKISEKKIDVRNPGETISHIERIKGSDIHGLISKLELLSSERHAIGEEIISLDRIAAETREELLKKESHEQALAETTKRINELEEELQKEKGVIEQLLLKHYKRKITIALR